MTEPIRCVQKNLRQTDASLDPKHLVGQLICAPMFCFSAWAV